MKTQNTLHLAGLLLLILLSCAALLGTAASAEAQEVHALLIIQGNDMNIRAGVEKNESHLKELMGRVSAHCPVQLTVLKSEGTGTVTTMSLTDGKASDIQETEQEGPITSGQVEAWLNAVDAKPNDTVLVYYTGFGLISASGSGDDLARADLSAALNEHPARLKMLITDMNGPNVDESDTPQIRVDESDTPQIAQVVMKRKLSILKHLFLEHKGMLDITAASPGEEAWGDRKDGFFFTNALIASMASASDANEDGFISWTEAFEFAQKLTQAVFVERTSYVPGRKQLTQTPVVYSPLPTKIDMEKRPVQKPSKTATLSITSLPSGGTVYLEGEAIGTTPLQGYKMSLGTRNRKTVRVTIGKKGDAVYFPRPKNLKLTPNQETSLHFQEESLQQRQQVDLSKMVLIPAGKFRMGTDGLAGESGESSKPIHSVSLDAFYIDTHEVTVGEYKRFLEATGHAPLPKAVEKFSPTDMHPVVGVSWRDAMAYATWAGKRLPTEAEWEKAARGGLLDKNFPWGDEKPNSALANYGKLVGTTTPVGEYPPNGYGLYDVAGNVAEWCLDVWEEDFYTRSPEENPFAGPKSRYIGLGFQTSEGLRVVRGGAWISMEPGSLYVGGRGKAEALRASKAIGFRCAKDASP